MTDTTLGVGIGIVGAGFLAATRARCYRRVSGARVLAVHDADHETARAFAARHKVPHADADLDALLARDDIHLVDLCVPNRAHRPLAARAAAAGKEIACTKPLTAYVGQDLAENAAEEAVAKVERHRMWRVAEAEARAMVSTVADAGVRLMYGENWIYAPAIARARGLLRAATGPILEMRGSESHCGSHSSFARRWSDTGGGALLRLGAHPIGAMLHLKCEEGRARHGAPIRPVAVTADVADLSAVDGVDPDHAFVATGWGAVENWGCAVITFSDGSRGIAYGSDNLLGGMESRLELLTADAHLKCNLSPNDMLRAYTPRAEGFEDEYIMEKTDTSVGWSTPMPDEDWTSGHQAMCEDFVRAVAEDRAPVADGDLGVEVVRVVYAAYAAAESGRRVALD